MGIEFCFKLGAFGFVGGIFTLDSVVLVVEFNCCVSARTAQVYGTDG